jgi:uncharacterized protein (TIGR00725 family)
MKRPVIIGVMGGGAAARADAKAAYHLGELIAQNGWVLLNGGRSSGIMDASAKGARDKGGLTIGILPDENPQKMSRYIDIPIITGMGSARNCINVLTSDIVVACHGGPGTLSEVALALKHNKAVILLNYRQERLFETYHQAGQLFYADSPEQVIEIIKSKLIPDSGGLRPWPDLPGR